MATDFIVTVKSSGGDYSNLGGASGACAKLSCDLTVSTTKVFSHGGIVGSLADGASLTGASSGATGVLVHATATQILIKTISGTFQNGEQIYSTININYVIASNAGDSAQIVVNPYAFADTAAAVAITGTYGTNNRFKIITPLTERFSKCQWEAGKYRLEYAPGFSVALLDIQTNYVTIEGLQIKNTSNGGSGSNCIHTNSNVIGVLIDKCIIWKSGTGDATIEVNGSTTIRNCFLIQTASNPYCLWDHYTSGYVATYENITIILTSGTTGFASFFTVTARNILIKGASTRDFELGGGGYTCNLYNCASHDGTADDYSGSNNRVNQTFTFVNEAGSEYTLSESDNGAREFGSNLIATFQDDIVGRVRPGLGPWDIGASEAEGQPVRKHGKFIPFKNKHNAQKSASIFNK